MFRIQTAVVLAALALGLAAATIAAPALKTASTTQQPTALAQQAATPAQPTATMTPTAHRSGMKHAGARQHAAVVKVDVNTATREELLRLPGVNEATADKIIAARPFKSKAELKSRHVLDAAEYAKVASRVMVRSTISK